MFSLWRKARRETSRQTENANTILTYCRAHLLDPFCHGQSPVRIQVKHLNFIELFGLLPLLRRSLAL
ncbi:hypothetical protein, partial [Thiolapillus sp.]|uniref:hypothetical protein n=1 Tax=Thiolapillus sp. TaxID=2017437 RepID=UPI003AF686C8